MAPPRSGGPLSPPLLGPSATESADEEIQREFREFRESAVRLAERVRDLSSVEADPLAAARADLHLVRSIFGKWSSDVLITLHTLPSAGFEELRRNLRGISPRVLSLKLKELEENGMLHREILDSRPPRVRYSLSEKGWTVAWLSQPVLLYLRHTGTARAPGPTPANGSEAEVPEFAGALGDGGQERRGAAEREGIGALSPGRPSNRRGRNAIGRSRLETVAL